MIGIYERLSRYDADEGVVIAYGSMYGNTEQMAEAIAEELSAQGVKNIRHTVIRFSRKWNRYCPRFWFANSKGVTWDTSVPSLGQELL